MSAQNLEHLPLAALTPYAANSRTHSGDQVRQIAASIQEFGFTNPVLIDGDGGIIAGHGRVQAAQLLGLATVPCLRLAHMTDAQKRAYIIADNQLALNAGWDESILATELQALEGLEFDLGLIGFDSGELDRLLALSDDESAGEPDSNLADAGGDDIPDAPVNPVSRPGDIWLLGAHRLICGDAADPAAIHQLMMGEKARLCFTSPPYGNQRDYTSGGITDWEGLMRGVFAQLPMTFDAQVLVNLGLIHRDNEVIPYWDGWLSWMRTQGWRRFAWYVWDQGPGMPGDWAGRLAPSFEFIFHLNRESRKPNKIVPCKHAGQESHLRPDGSSTAMRNKAGDVGSWQHAGQPTQDTRIPDSVIRIMRHKGKIGKDIDHPAVFPIALPEFVIEAYSEEGDIVFEPFGGSGSTLLACQRTGRQGRAVEIAPEYVDVAIQRFQQNHPDIPVTLESTAQTFEEIKRERVHSPDQPAVSSLQICRDQNLVNDEAAA